MPRPAKERTQFGARMHEARTRAGLSQEKVATKLDISQGTLSGLERTAEGSSLVVQFARLYGCNVDWLATGESLPEVSPVAQDMSQSRPSVALPRVRWEDLLSADLSQPFELVVADDALAPDIVAGCVARFDPAMTPRPGRPVLVSDADGRHYIRDYTQGPAGTWQATARMRGFAALDSQEHGLRVVAVMKGIDWS